LLTFHQGLLKYIHGYEFVYSKKYFLKKGDRREDCVIFYLHLNRFPLHVNSQTNRTPNKIYEI
jgi:hypothetical protein